MIEKFKEETLISDVVSVFPEGANILLEYKLDFCCGGNRSIKEAAGGKTLI